MIETSMDDDDDKILACLYKTVPVMDVNINAIHHLTHSLPCPAKVGNALSPSRHTRMPREGMLKTSGLPHVKRNVP
jgi:hypothetical protein